MISLALAAIGGVILLLVIIVAVGLWVTWNRGDSDVVSAARQDWINRRSDEDREGW